jgi:hypothetical protein
MPLFAILLSVAMSAAAEADAPKTVSKPVPAMQVVPLPHDEASFQYLGRELTRYHFSSTQQRPFCYPMQGSDGRSLTRMGHPHDPITHSHHNSVWISHQNVAGVDFWADHADHGQAIGRIVPQRVEQYEDGDRSAWLLCVNAWQTGDGKTLLLERRRIEVDAAGEDNWLMLMDLQLETPGSEPVTLGKTPFGLIGVRMAKTIGVNDGGGRILNSAGQRNEKEMFRKPARWVDYSGPVTNERHGGITLMDHPSNAGSPAPFHVRDDGWMGACLTLNAELVIEPGKPLRLRYGLWRHDGEPEATEIESHWKPFAETALPKMTRDAK